MDYSEYEVTEDGVVYTFEDAIESVSMNTTFPRKDLDGNQIDITDSNKFSRFDLKIADHLMYMDAHQIADFVAQIDDSSLLRSIIVEQKKLQEQLEWERHDDEVMRASTKEQEEALREEYQPLGSEELLDFDVGEAIRHLSKHQVSVVDYDYGRINEESGTDEQVEEYADRSFDSFTNLLFEVQQDYSRGVPRQLLERLAEDHLGWVSEDVDRALDEYVDSGQVHEEFPHHYRAYWP